jgi:hypothetical protein
VSSLERLGEAGWLPDVRSEESSCPGVEILKVKNRYSIGTCTRRETSLGGRAVSGRNAKIIEERVMRPNFHVSVSVSHAPRIAAARFVVARAWHCKV